MRCSVTLALSPFPAVTEPPACILQPKPMDTAASPLLPFETAVHGGKQRRGPVAANAGKGSAPRRASPRCGAWLPFKARGCPTHPAGAEYHLPPPKFHHLKTFSEHFPSFLHRNPYQTSQSKTPPGLRPDPHPLAFQIKRKPAGGCRDRPRGRPGRILLWAHRHRCTAGAGGKQGSGGRQARGNEMRAQESNTGSIGVCSTASFSVQLLHSIRPIF